MIQKNFATRQVFSLACKTKHKTLFSTKLKLCSRNSLSNNLEFNFNNNFDKLTSIYTKIHSKKYKKNSKFFYLHQLKKKELIVSRRPHCLIIWLASICCKGFQFFFSFFTKIFIHMQSKIFIKGNRGGKKITKESPKKLQKKENGGKLRVRWVHFPARVPNTFM